MDRLTNVQRKEETEDRIDGGAKSLRARETERQRGGRAKSI